MRALYTGPEARRPPAMQTGQRTRAKASKGPLPGLTPRKEGHLLGPTDSRTQRLDENVKGEQSPGPESTSPPSVAQSMRLDPQIIAKKNPEIVTAQTDSVQLFQFKTISSSLPSERSSSESRRQFWSAKSPSLAPPPLLFDTETPPLPSVTNSWITGEATSSLSWLGDVRVNGRASAEPDHQCNCKDVNRILITNSDMSCVFHNVIFPKLRPSTICSDITLRSIVQKRFFANF